MEEIKTLVEMLKEASQKLEKKLGKRDQERNVLNESKKYIRKVSKYLYNVKVASFKLEADGKGTPPPQERTIEPEHDDSESVVAASNAETPKAKAKAKRARKSRKTKK
jgi:hypothetical protein